MYKAVIVDDEKIVRVALKTMLDWDKAGFEICQSVGSAEAALKAIHRFSPDLVITDIVMPDMDGLDLIRSARNAGFAGDFIILTNYQNFDYAIEALHNEVLDYIIKTDISPEIIGKAVRKAGEKIGSRRKSAHSEEGETVSDDDTDRIRRHLLNPEKPFVFSAPCHALFIFLPSSLESSPPEISPGLLQNVTGEAVKDLHDRLISLTPDTLLIPLSIDFAAKISESGNKILPRIQNLVQLYMNSECGFVLTSSLGSTSDLDRALNRCRVSARAVLYDGFSTLLREEHATAVFFGRSQGKENLCGSYPSD